MHTGGEFLSGITRFAILNYFKVDENNIIHNAFKADNLRNPDSIGNKTEQFFIFHDGKTVVLHALHVLYFVLYPAVVLIWLELDNIG